MANYKTAKEYWEAQKKKSTATTQEAPPTVKPGITGAHAGVTVGVQRPSAAPVPGTSALPPKKPTPAPPAFMPLIDPNRVRAGDTTKTGLARTKLIQITPAVMAGLKLTGRDKVLGLKVGDEINLGDLFPNLQQAMTPITRPEQTAAELQKTPAGEEWSAAVANFKTPETPIQQALRTGLHIDTRGLQAIGAGLTEAGKFISSSDTPVLKAIGGAMAGAPQTAMNLLSVPSQMAEQTIGTAAQAAGLSGVNPAQAMVPRKFIAMAAQSGAQIARALGAEDVAQELDKHTQAPPGIVANLVANVIARQRAAGQDTTLTEQILNNLLAAPATNVWGTAIPSTQQLTPPDAETLIKTQEEAMSNAGGMSPEAWKSSMFSYEGPEYVAEAQQRLAAGEDWDTVYNDIENKLTPEARAQDIVGQMVLDPLNALEAVGGVPKLLGMGTRRERWLGQVGQEFMEATPEGMGLIKMAERGGDVRQVGNLGRKVRELPFIGAIVKPLPETLFNRRFEEMVTTMKMIVGGISPEAEQRLLEAGIDVHPKALAFEAFMKNGSPDVIRDLDGIPVSSQKIQELLGMAGHVPTREEIELYRLAPGAQIDMWNSNAADRARDLWLKMGQENSDVAKLADDFEDIQKVYHDAMRGDPFIATEKTIDKLGVEATKEVVYKGEDAITMAEKKLGDWMENVKASTMKAAGYEAPTGMYKNILAVRKKMQGIQGVFAWFQIRTNWGNPIRNWATNSTISFVDGIDAFSSLRGTEDEIARLGLGGMPGLGRSFGGQVDIALKAGEPTQGTLGLFEKLKPLGLSQRFETNAGKRLVVQTFQKHMATEWRIGKAIPEKEWAMVAQAFGDRAQEVKAMLENARTLDDMNAIVARVTDDDPWRASVHVALSGTHDEALLADLDNIAKTATDQADWENKVQDYVYQNRNQFNEFMNRGYVMEGTPASDAMKAAKLATDGLPPKRRAEILDKFAKDLVRQDASFDLYKSYSNQAIAALQGIKPEDVAKAGFAPPPGTVGTFNEWLLTRRGKALESLDGAKQAIRGTQYEVLDAIQKKDWDRLQALGDEWGKAHPGKTMDDVAQLVSTNPFMGSSSNSSAWDAYFRWTDEYWAEYRTSLYGEFGDIQKTAADAVEAVKKIRPPNVPIDMVDDFLPLTRAEQRMYAARLDQIGAARGLMDRQAIRDALQQEDVLHADRIWRGDIQDKDWYKQAEAAMMRYSKKEGTAAGAAGAAAKAQSTAADDMADIMESLSKEPVDARMADQVSGQAATMAERDAQIDKVLETVRNAPPGTAIEPKAIKNLKEFVKTLEPRMTEVRTAGEQLATYTRDFALLDYGDKSGFDLLAGMLYNYPKWYMGTIKNMAVRALDNPGRIAALFKLRGQLRTINRNLPEWWQDQISLNINGNPIFLNLLATIDPLNGFLGDKFRDPDLYNKDDPLSQMMAEAQQYGPGLHGLLSSLMFARAFAKGDKEAMMGWIGNLGPATKGITAITTLAKEYGGKAMDFIPPGGVVVEPWLWNFEGGKVQMTGTKYDARRVGLSLGELVTQKQITAEQAYDAMLAGSGPLYDRALQMSKEKTAWQSLASWLLGAGVKPRPGIEIEVQRMDADRIALMQAKSDGFYDGRPEAYRAAWEEMRTTYPWMDFVQGFRRDQTGRANIYAMSVYDRLPPNPRPYFKALGLDEDIYSDLLNKFYGDKPGQKPCDINNLPPASRELFMSMMKLMGATLSLPNTATGNEWNMARQARAAMYDGLNRQYANIEAVQDEYYNILNREENKATAGVDAEKYLKQHGELQAYWDDKDAAIAADPILAKYWGSMELFERVSKDEFERKMDATYPGLRDQIDEYYRIKDTDPAAAKAYLKTHKNVTDYWSKRTEWTLGLDTELMQMAGGITNLEGEWGSLRTDTTPEMAGQQRVIDLIESGARPMGDFELPEDMDARQVQAGIQMEMDKYQGNWGALYRQLKGMGGLDKTLTAFQEFASGKAGVETVMGNLAEAKALLVALSTINEGTGGVAGVGGGGGAGGGTGGSGSGRAAEVDNALKYLAAVGSDGDYMNDWLTHTSSGIAQAMQQFGQMAAGNPGAIDAANKYLQAIAEDGDYMNDWLTHVPPEMRASLQNLGQLIAESKGSRKARLIRSHNYGGARPPKENKAQQVQSDEKMDTFMAQLQQQAPMYAGMLQNVAEMDPTGILAYLEANPVFYDWLKKTGLTLEQLIGYFKRRNLARAAVSLKATKTTKKK